MLIGILAVAWLFAVVAILIGWAGFNAHVRAIEGVDGAAYSNGLDDRSLAEAA